MIHYTLNTGHTRDPSPRSEVSDETIKIVEPWCVNGTHELPMPGWSMVVTIGERGGLLATLYCERAPVVSIAVAPDDAAAAELWPAIESLYHKITDLPQHRGLDWALAKQPARTPWCAVTLNEASDIYKMADWLGDFERCLAWAWIGLRARTK